MDLEVRDLGKMAISLFKMLVRSIGHEFNDQEPPLVKPYGENIVHLDSKATNLAW